MLKKLKILLKLLKRITVHKFWVAYYCFQLGLYWQGITHDLSKFSLTEIKGAIKYWDNNISSLANERKILGYSKTFLHHRGRNPHHYEYWIHSLDDGGIPALIPKKYVLELVCDYLAACKTYGSNPKEEYNWWKANNCKMRINSLTKNYIGEVFYYFQYDNLKTAVDRADNSTNIQGYAEA